jgi:hypothetical protein
MEPLEPQVHSFIVKIWIEAPEPGPDGEREAWHGLISHLPDGGRLSFRDVRAIVPFVESYLDQSAPRSTRARLAQAGAWLRRLRRS